ncbi:MAG: lipid IV(A) 3-deoxy-D-manno-octulosonic acid transferase [Pseudomonadota bacterium]
MRFLYTLLFYFAIPAILLRLLWRGVKAPEYRYRWSERFGFFNAALTFQKTVWVHAVSVGEVLAAKHLIDGLRQQHTTANIVITCTTPTGSAQISRLFGDSVFHIYAPYDLPDVIRRFLLRIKPNLLIIMETEVWPNMITLCHSKNIPIVLANARLSEQSFANYQRLQAFSQSIFSKIDNVATQTDVEAGRFKQLGVENTTVTGSIKHDIKIGSDFKESANELRCLLDDFKKIIVIASTHRGEDAFVLDALQAVYEKKCGILLVLAPRHLERLKSIEKLCKQRSLALVRRSAIDTINKDTQVLLIDTMGELMSFYGVADITIMGGTFVEHGGHNFLEPAAWGIPMISGLSVFNFSHIAKELVELGALQQVSSSKALGEAVKRLLSNKAEADERGVSAYQYIERNRGALKKLQAVIESYLAF